MEITQIIKRNGETIQLNTNEPFSLLSRLEIIGPEKARI